MIRAGFLDPESRRDLIEPAGRNERPRTLGFWVSLALVIVVYFVAIKT
jgi:hypothetical protein